MSDPRGEWAPLPGILPLATTDPGGQQAYDRVYNTPWGIGPGGVANWWGGGSGQPLPGPAPQPAPRETTGPNVPSRYGSVIPYPAARAIAALGITQDQYDAFRGYAVTRESQSYGELPNGDRHSPIGLAGQTRQGYMGRYQMGSGEIIASARGLGMRPPSQQEFLANPQLQEQLFEQYLLGHHQELMSIPQYASGDPITRLSLLFGSHLGGLPGVRAWETGSYFAPDINKTTVPNYIQSMYSALGGQGRLTPQGLGDVAPRREAALGPQYAQAGFSDVPLGDPSKLSPATPLTPVPGAPQMMEQRPAGQQPQGGQQPGPGTGDQPTADDTPAFKPMAIKPPPEAQLEPLPKTPHAADFGRRPGTAAEPATDTDTEPSSELGPPKGFGPVQMDVATSGGEDIYTPSPRGRGQEPIVRPIPGAPGGGTAPPATVPPAATGAIPDGTAADTGGAAAPQPSEPAVQPDQPAAPAPGPEIPAGTDDRHNAIATGENTTHPQGGINWNRVSNSPDQPLENMPIAQVAELPQGEDFGGMQIHRRDLVPIAQALGLDPHTTNFTADVQKKFADYVFNREGPGYWRGVAANPRAMDQANGLIFGATQAGKDALEKIRRDSEEAHKAYIASQQALTDALSQGKFDSPYWREQQREAFEAQKRWARAYQQVVLNPPNRTSDDLAQGMGSMTGAAGMIAGLISFLPMVASMDGLAAAISARTARNDYDYQQAMDRYKTTATMAANGMRLEGQLYNEALAGREADFNTTVAKLTAIGQQFKNATMMHALDTHDYQTAVELPQKLIDLAENFERSRLAYEALDGAKRQIDKELNDWRNDPKNAQILAANGGQIPWEARYPIMQKALGQLHTLETELRTSGKDPSAKAETEREIDERAGLKNRQWDRDHPNASPSDREQAYSDNRLTARREVSEAGSKAVPGLEVSKQYEIVDEKTGNVIGPPLELREYKDKTGFVHSEDGTPLVLQPGQRVRGITPTQAGGGRAGQQVLRQIVGGREVLSDLQNVSMLPVGQTTSTLYGYDPGKSLWGILATDLVRHLTDQDAALMQGSMAGLQRELSILQSPVYVTQGSIDQLDKLVPMKGDTVETAIYKIARSRQVADNALEGLSKSPLVSNKEREYAKQIRAQLRKYIPYSSADIVEWTRGGKSRTETFGQFLEREGISKPPTPPTTRAINYLREHPETRAQFDEKYGEGAAASALEE